MSALPPRAPNHILAIDGPAGAGKSTVASRMAARFDLLNIETGAMYRAFALKALRSHVSLADTAALEGLSHATVITLQPGAGRNRVLLDGDDVTALVRTPAVSEAASQVSVHPPVRAWLVGLQQAIGRAAQTGVVMEGRDIGTVVFPDASLKIFLSASPAARSERRLLQQGGTATDQAAVQNSILSRDDRDRTRSDSPLRPAEDAVQIDSTRLTLPEVLRQVECLVRERWGIAAGIR